MEAQSSPVARILARHFLPVRRSVSVLEVGMITLYGFKRVHRPLIRGTRDLRAQWALEEPGLSI